VFSKWFQFYHSRIPFSLSPTLFVLRDDTYTVDLTYQNLPPSLIFIQLFNPKSITTIDLQCSRFNGCKRLILFTISWRELRSLILLVINDRRSL
jgi:hypothetical protein